MKNLIIACGNYGSTLKAASILSRCLKGESIIFDPENDSPPNLEDYDNIILGGNIRMGKLNKNFRRYATKLKKAKENARIYAFILCGFADKAEGYLQKAESKLPFAERVDYVGGILSAENATGFWAQVIVDAREGLKKEGKPLPNIDRKKLEHIAAEINSVYE